MARRFITLGLLLLAGAIVNVAVAWELALWSPAHEPFIYRDDSAASLHWLSPAPPPWQEAQREWVLNSRGLRITIVGALDYAPSTGLRQSEYRQQRFETGFPFLSLAMLVNKESVSQPPGQTAQGVLTWRGRWRLPVQNAANQSSEVPLQGVPLIPLFPGFAINTIFYAAIQWLLFAAPFKVRRWRRIRRGQCPACAYPVGTSPTCTEYGTRLRVQLRSQSMSA